MVEERVGSSGLSSAECACTTVGAAAWGRGRFWRVVAAYGLVALLAVLASARVLRLWEADLGVPFVYKEDALVNHLLSEHEIDSAELAQLKALIAAREEGL